MNRFSPDLDLSCIVGRPVNFIGIDQNAVYLTLNADMRPADKRPFGGRDKAQLDSDAYVTISCGWSLASDSGSVIDRWMEHAERNSYQIHVLLGLKLLGYSVISETDLELRFENG